jgi:hypothetical protein
VAAEQRATATSRWIIELETLATLCGMRELLARALLHRGRLGDAAAFEAARELVAAIINPALTAELAVTLP